ncbi:hypothetical protein OIU84_006944 [Salix udensis]|uniref:Uncharacterized protein n=1 Tax=Salix udensis TaxID=889485 RepID=A0AAD6JZG8_9ROSI|nr:hypothetical protein OIU84_006944 [Salix udensis]
MIMVDEAKKSSSAAKAECITESGPNQPSDFTSRS